MQPSVDCGGAPRKGDDEVFVAGFAVGLTAAAVAGVAGVSERTARRRRNEPSIASQVRARRAEIADDTAGRLAALGSRAVEVLEDCLDAEDARDRLSAAKSLLQIGPKFRAEVEFEDRLRALEAVSSGDRADVGVGDDPLWEDADDER
jgi:hypothetical protein